MFFLIGGVQSRTIKVEEQARACPNCGSHSAYLKRVDQYLSLFFIPLFPIKKGQPFIECDRCKAALDPMGYGASQTHAGRCNYCRGRLETDFSYCPSCGKKT